MHDENEQAWLKEVRAKIDEIDGQLLTLLKERIDIVAQVGEWKKEQGLPVKDENREVQLLNKLKSKETIPDKLVEEVWRSIINHSCETQEKIKLQ